jgi:tetratricopeptide (TPR) repeat protein
VVALRERALAVAEKAVALAPDLPDALSTRAVLRGLTKRDWIGAKTDLERAIALNGNDADSRRRYGALLAILGRLPDGIAQVRKAIEIDPLGQAWGTLGWLYQGSGELELSAAAYRRYLEISPGSAPMMLGLGRALLLQSKAKAALEVFEKCPVEEYELWGRAIAEHSMGNEAASQAALRTLVSKYAHTSALRIAEVHAWRGEKEPALHWLERASAGPGGLEEVKPNPFLQSLGGEPRYAALLEKMKLPAK